MFQHFYCTKSKFVRRHLKTRTQGFELFLICFVIVYNLNYKTYTWWWIWFCMEFLKNIIKCQHIFMFFEFISSTVISWRDVQKLGVPSRGAWRPVWKIINIVNRPSPVRPKFLDPPTLGRVYCNDLFFVFKYLHNSMHFVHS